MYRILPEKLIVPQVVKKFPAFYGTRKLQQHTTFPCPEPDQSSATFPIIFLLRSILILFSHLRLCLARCLFRLLYHNTTRISVCSHTRRVIEIGHNDVNFIVVVCDLFQTCDMRLYTRALYRNTH